MSVLRSQPGGSLPSWSSKEENCLALELDVAEEFEAATPGNWLAADEVPWAEAELEAE